MRIVSCRNIVVRSHPEAKDAAKTKKTNPASAPLASHAAALLRNPRSASVNPANTLMPVTAPNNGPRLPVAQRATTCRTKAAK